MGDLTIKGIDDQVLEVLRRRAIESGVDLGRAAERILEASALLTPSSFSNEYDMLTEQERKHRAIAAAEAAELRARTIEPLWADSTLIIREGRDIGWR